MEVDAGACDGVVERGVAEFVGDLPVGASRVVPADDADEVVGREFGPEPVPGLQLSDDPAEDLVDLLDGRDVAAGGLLGRNRRGPCGESGVDVSEVAGVPRHNHAGLGGGGG